MPLTLEQERLRWLHLAITQDVLRRPEEALRQALSKLDRDLRGEDSGPRSAEVADAWRELIRAGVGAVLDVFIADDRHSCALREESPFVATMSADLRSSVLAAFEARAESVTPERGASRRAPAARSGLAPHLLRSLRAELEFLQEVEATHGLLGVLEAGQLIAPRSTDPVSEAHRARKDGRLLGIKRGGFIVFPGFQFEGGALRAVMARLLKVGERYGYDEMSLLVFLCSPSTYVVDGRHPVELIDDPERIVEVTQRALGVIW